MTNASSRSRELRPELAEAHGRFASALGEVTQCTGLTQERIARKAGIAQGTLSGYLHGGRLPKAGYLERVYKVLDQHARKTHRRLPYALADLRQLRDQALRDRHESRTVGGASPVSPVGDSPAATQLQTPASPRVRQRPHIQRRVRRYSRRHRFSSPLARTAVPVPPMEGDRHRSLAASEAAWSVEAEEIRRHFEEGREWDAYVMLRNTASRVTAEEFPGVVSSCRAAGLEEAVETLLQTAAQREVRAVLNITAALHDRHQYEDAGVLLAAARAASL